MEYTWTKTTGKKIDTNKNMRKEQAAFSGLFYIYIFMKATDIPGWMTNEELKRLALMASQANSWLEIGVWCGRSTFAVAENLPLNAKLTVVDPFANFIPYYKNHKPNDHWPREQFQKVIDWISENRPDIEFKLIEKTTQDASNDIPNKFDVAFIDGDHGYISVIFDFKLCENKVKKNGILSGHDYCSKNGPQVVPAVNFCSKKKAQTYPNTTIWWCINAKPV